MALPSKALQEIVEWRGVEGLVAAEVTVDDNEVGEGHGYVTGDVFAVAGVAEISRSTDSSNEAHYYDSTTGALIEGPRDFKYFALGYKTKKTNGDEVYVWRYKGTFSIPDQTNSTENDGTDANGQEIVFTGISTTHKFTKTGKGAKALNVDLGKNLADVSTFFDAVTTPDTLAKKNG